LRGKSPAVLRDAVRAEATERTWTQGVQLSREQRVTSMRKSGDEIELDVRVPGRATPCHVVLNPNHDEWECDCPSKETVCSHVVAAVLAVEQGDGQLPTPSKKLATVRYLLEPDAGGVRVERQLVHDGGTEPLDGSIVPKLSGIATQE
jgi:uncharacterized Zn finger protein